jgi:hypothetical protein
MHRRRLWMAGVALGMAVLMLAGVAAQLSYAQTGMEPQGPSEPIGVLSTPAPGSKIAVQPPAFDPDGVTLLDRAGAGTKNAAEVHQAAVPQIAGDSHSFMACGEVGNLNWKTTSTAWQVIRSCTATLPEAGVVFINATAGVGMQDTAYEGQFGLNIDNAAASIQSTNRWVNIYPDGGDGTDKSVATSLLLPMSAGTHTFYFLGARYGSGGTVLAYDPALSVAYFPSAATPVKTCGVSSSATFTTTSSTFIAVQTCSLTVPGPGWVYVNATASAGLPYGGGPYEVRYHVAMDDNSLNTGWPDHWTNVYTDTGDGTDEALASSMLTHIGSGAHTFYFGAQRYAGSGTVQLYNPALSVLYFPDNSVVAKSCGSFVGSGDWQNSTTSYITIRACTLDVPGRGFAIVDANASAGLLYGSANWEGLFGWGVDDANGSDAYDRWINVSTDSGDGTDRVVATSGLIDVSAGPHTFYFVGRRYSGTGTVELIRPSLTVLVPAGRVFLPLVLK